MANPGRPGDAKLRVLYDAQDSLAAEGTDFMYRENARFFDSGRTGFFYGHAQDTQDAWVREDALNEATPII